MPTALIIGDSHVDKSAMASEIRKQLEQVGWKVTVAGVGSTSAGSWKGNSVCRVGEKNCLQRDTLPKGVDLLIVSLGTNDLANAAAAKANFQKRADQCIDRVTSLKYDFQAKKLFWIGPPWMGDKMKWYRNEYLAPLYDQAKIRGIEIFDSRPVTKPLVEAGSGDGVHLGAKGQRAWASEVVKKIRSSTSTNVNKIIIGTSIAAVAVLTTVIILARK